MSDVARPAGSPPPVLGRWTFDVGSGLATYDEDLLAMYGVGLTNPGPPEEVQRRIHPDDLPAVQEATAGALARPGPVTARYRFRTGNRGERILVVAGDPVVRDGRIAAVAGFTIDVTEAAQHEVNAAVEASREHRAAIEQVKGALTATYALEDDVAFQLLRRASMEHNTKVADLAEAVMSRLRDPQDRFHQRRDLALLELVEQTAAALKRR